MKEKVMISTVRVGGGWMTIAYSNALEVVSNSHVASTAGQSLQAVVADLKARRIKAVEGPAGPAVRQLAAQILEGDASVKISRVGSTVFRWDVLQFVRGIPRGRVASYSDVARGVGKPGAQRAVGTIMATHCLAYIIPCHRVVRNDLSPGGFSSTRSKVEMLIEEGVGVEGGRIRERHRLAPDR